MKVESQESRVEGRKRSIALRSRSGSRLWTLDSRLRSGVTLIELLVTIMIISILAAAVLGVAAVAGETAREAKTRTIISRIHTLLMQHYDTYTTRRVKLRPAVGDQIRQFTGAGVTTAKKGRLKAEARLYALREMMLMEVPDRWSDITLTPLPTNDSSIITTYSPAVPLYLDVSNSANGRSDVANLYLRTFDRITKTTNKITGSRNTVGEIRANQSAECLYMVVMNACGDGESRTLFPESSIGDTDGDGAPEFLDGWGHPIQFLRWAPGFESDIQMNAVDLDAPLAGSQAEAWQNAGTSDHDPFDLYRAQPVAFRLTPLVFSAGRDEEGGLITEADRSVAPWRTTTGLAVTLSGNFSADPPYVMPALNPYINSARYLGEIVDKSLATDNIHNHLIGTK